MSKPCHWHSALCANTYMSFYHKCRWVLTTSPIKIQDDSITTKISLLLVCHVTSTPSAPTTLNPWQPRICFLSLQVCHFKNGYRNGITRYINGFLETGFLHSVLCHWDPSESLCVSTFYFFFFNCWLVFRGVVVPVCFTIHLLRDIWAVCSFWLLHLKLLWIIRYGFLCGLKFLCL